MEGSPRRAGSRRHTRQAAGAPRSAPLRGQVQQWDPYRGGEVAVGGARYWLEPDSAVMPAGGPWLCSPLRAGLIVEFDPAPATTAGERLISVVHRVLPPDREPVTQREAVEMLELAGPVADLSVVPAQVHVTGAPADGPRTPCIVQPSGATGGAWGKQWTNQASDGVREGVPQSPAASLSVAGTGMGSYGAACLASGLAAGTSRLTALDLSRCYILDAGARELAAILPSTRIQRLDLWQNKIDDGGVAAIASALPGSKITWLGLRSNYIKAVGMEHLACALPTSLVSYLDCGNNFIGDAGLEALSRHLRDSRVETLLLEGCDARAAGAEYLASTQSSTEALAAASLGQEAAEALKQQPLAKVRGLDLSYNALGDAGVRHLADNMSRMRALRSLCVGHIGMTDRGFRRLLDALKAAPTLRHVDASGNQIVFDKDTVKVFAAAMVHTNVSSLILVDNQIPDTCGTMRLRKTVIRKLQQPAEAQEGAGPELEPVGIEVEPDGRTILSVAEGGPAARAGLQAGQEILRLAGRRIANKTRVVRSQVEGPFDLDSGLQDPRISGNDFAVEVTAKSTRSGALGLLTFLEHRIMPPDPGRPLEKPDKTLWTPEVWASRALTNEGKGQPRWGQLALPTKLRSIALDGNPVLDVKGMYDIQQRIDAQLRKRAP